MKIIPDSITPRYLAIVGIVLIMITLVAGFPGSYTVGLNDPELSQNLEIRTWYDLNAVRDNLSGNHILMNDLNSKANPPIYHGLSGTFDGQGYEICDLFINNPDESLIGFFRYVNEGGIIKNVGMVNFTVNGYNMVGSFAGQNNGGTIMNCYSIGDVTGQAAIGGLVGRLYSGTISNSYSTGSVTGESSTGIGDLVGQQHPECTISNSYSTCSVVGGSVGSGDIGGLVGDNYYVENVISCFWDTETSGQSTSGGGTGKNTTEMQKIATFSSAGWNIIAVALNETNPDYIWNIVNNVTYPFLGWQL